MWYSNTYQDRKSLYLSPGYVSNSKRHRKSTLCIQRIMNDGSKRESINCHHYRKGERRATLPSCLLPLLLFEIRQFQSNSTTQCRWRRGGGEKWRGAWLHSGETVQRWYGGEMARVGARWYGTYLSLLRGAVRRGDYGGGLLWTLRFWGISASLHNWTIVSCTFLWDPQSVKTTDYGCLIKFFLSNVLADCTQKLWIWSLISFKLWTS